MDIKETKELLKAVSFLISKCLEIAKDGVEPSDLVKVLDIVKEHAMLIEGFKNLGLVDDELKNLSQEEAIELLVILFSEIKKVKEA